ncbi:hypothetical protein JCM21714_3332 [Gracilibacillus boraciitolerans JCM 21714]|uniref:Uncharacterized protein n=1 Tax=Gracilibacillus boraciitolerans JCM 21714 TaxID=1298598 RepID=W4VLD2_9BACI|nr:polysaccharide biosynthesis C-terminal domain-containing protein [Gracilibacillus boraciitolerans]GAE94195.1 hypothetical protein JCM21714_3332 [Gracilibacillus boraciitolerans JCM 21714]
MKWTAFTLFLGLLIKIVLNQWLIPWFGIRGGALATVITVFFIFISNFLLLRYTLKYAPVFMVSWLKIITAGFWMAILLSGLKLVQPLLFQIDNRIILFFFVTSCVTLGLIVYAMLILYGKVLSQKEIESFSMFNKWKKGKR